MNTKHRNQSPIIDSFNDDNIKFFALGGLGEVGKNMYVFECKDEIIIIDSGIMFPDSGYGVDYIIPDYTYLKNNEHKIKGLFITHGHEDHIGGIPHLVKSINIPYIYSNGLATHLIKMKFSEFNINYSNLIEFTNDSIIKFKNFEISFIRTNHSIPDSYAIAIKTKLGYIIHTGDFKFDFTPLANHTEYHKLSKYALEGVLCLLSDSTNALVNKFSVSERKISESIKSIFSNVSGRIIISTFASNVYRVQQIIEASIANNRKVVVYGRSMEKIIKIALKNGYISAPENSFVSGADVKHLSDEHITIISTGSQGEPLAALSRIANGTHKHIQIRSGDTIIFSSSAIPGNQESINRTINKLYKAGANVIVNSPLTDTHTSGHASETELQMMLSLTKPKYFIPIHGEYSMQKRHIELAIATGIDKNNCFILENGKVLTFNKQKVFSLYSVQSDNVYIDENNFNIENSLIKERKVLADDGLVAIIYTQNRFGELVQQPNIITRGFIYMKNTEAIMKAIKAKSELVYNSFTKKINLTPKDISNRNNYIIGEMSSFILQKTDRKPLIVPIFMSC